MFACREGLDRMKIRMTYCSQATGEIRCFYEEMSFDHLKEWFTALVRAYAPWVRLRLSFGRARQDTIRQMTFPFPYREGGLLSDSQGSDGHGGAGGPLAFA